MYNDREQCARCNRTAVAEIYCVRHYEQWLNEWSCYICGNVNGGSQNRAREICPKCKSRRGEGK